MATVTIRLDEPIFRRARRLAQTQQQELAEALANWLAETLPPVEEELIDAPLAVSDEDAAVQQEMLAFIALHPQLKERHYGKYVAVHRGVLVDVDETLSVLHRRVRAQYPNEFVWISKVEEEAIPTFTFRSPRLVSDEPAP